MLRVLIADDEQWIRKWLQKTVASISDELEVVAAVENGQEALSIIESEKIDIVISDIQMPLVTGLDLALSVQSLGLRPKFIFVSGYDRFGYVQKAIELDAISYLLKPIDRTELELALQKAIDSIAKERQSGASDEVFKDAIYRLLQSYLLTPSPDTLYRLQQTVNAAKYSGSGLYAGVFQWDISIEDNLCSAQLIEDTLSACFSNCICFYILEDNMNYVFVALKIAQNMPNDTEIQAKTVKETVLRVCDKCNIEISRFFSDITDLPAAVAEARVKILEGYIAQKSAIVDTSRGRLSAIRSNIILAVRSCSTDFLTESTAQLFDMFSGKNSKFDDCRYALFSLINEIIRIIADFDGSYENPYIARGYDFCVKINNYCNVPAMVEWFTSYATNVIEYLVKNQSFNVSHIAARVRNYLLEHYSEDICLGSICDKFEINASYFSKKFKEEIGMNFVDYLTSIRMDVARQLLETSSLSVSDISRDVGIKDSKYFSKLFQNAYGVCPTRYREQLTQNNERQACP